MPATTPAAYSMARPSASTHQQQHQTSSYAVGVSSPAKGPYAAAASSSPQPIGSPGININGQMDGKQFFQIVRYRADQ